MLDLNKIRVNPDLYLKGFKKRGIKVDLDEILNLDIKRKEIGKKRDELKNKRNVVSKHIPNLQKQGKNVGKEISEMRALGNQIVDFDKQYNEIEEKLFNLIAVLPNIPDEDIVAGGKEANKPIFTFGKKPEFKFKIKNHIELETDLKLIDYERGVKLAGASNQIYTGVGAQLEFALINFFVSEHLKDGWTFMLVPHMLKYECGYTAGQFPKFQEEVYWIDGGYRKDGKFILPTAETALVNLYKDEVLAESQLPIKLFSYTPCYRREAGSTRIEEKGIVRTHQFDKVEIVQYTTEDDSDRAFDEMVKKAEKLLQKLGLHYQLTKLAAGDISAGMTRTYDIEVWIPSMEKYIEVSSASNARDYQARRGNIKYKEANSKASKFVHTLNASGLALARTFVAILEQNQQADGSVKIPDALVPFMNGMNLITASGLKEIN